MLSDRHGKDNGLANIVYTWGYGRWFHIILLFGKPLCALLLNTTFNQ